MVFVSDGVASVAIEALCFLVDADGSLSSGFRFFSMISIAYSSLKLRVASSVGIVPGSCTLGMGWATPLGAGGGLLDEFPSEGVWLAGGFTLSVTRGRGATGGQ